MTTATEPRPDGRLVRMSAEQAQIVEAVCVRMVREKDERAGEMMSLSLAYKFAPSREPDVLDRVLGRLREDSGVEPPHPTLTVIHGGRDDA